MADEVFCFRLQIGLNITKGAPNWQPVYRSPVSVSGLGSGVAMIALGFVRFVLITSWRYVVLERSVCI